MKQLTGSTGALRAGPGSVIEGRELDGSGLAGGLDFRSAVPARLV